MTGNPLLNTQSNFKVKRRYCKNPVFFPLVGISNNIDEQCCSLLVVVKNFCYLPIGLIHIKVKTSQLISTACVSLEQSGVCL